MRTEAWCGFLERCPAEGVPDKEPTALIPAEFLVQKFSCLERVEDTGTSLEARRRAYNMAGAAGVRTRPSSSYWGRRRRHDRSF